MEENKSGLQTEPSFSIYNDETGEEKLESSGSGHFSFRRKSSMPLIQENEDEEVPLNEFKGLGINDGDVEENYKKIIKEDPYNSLLLRNYAQFLQSKGDLSGAEDYFVRATLADPNDSEILVQYAKLLWESHHDKDRALSYFEKATRAAPGDSHVLGAYAGFLWDMDEDEDEVEDERSFSHENLKVESDGQEDHRNLASVEEFRPASPPLHLAAGLGIDITGFGGSSSAFNYMTTDFADDVGREEYFRMMVEQHPSDPSFLRNFAHFLFEIKGDLPAAEEYYSRAILADPGNGEALSQYAKLIWQLHKDRQRASSYFEQAVQASPQDSTVLGAYARFLWESEDDEDENDVLWEARLPQAATAAANA